ncbi:MAG TPA: hypothetical protein VMT00_02660 [Thermoanaerobaculia bacterium]|nr:hypothetical protein [Thermoanaerobaculia bacterium]
MNRRPAIAISLLLLASFACIPKDDMVIPVTAPPDTLDELAASYVKLVLALGLHDADTVDAYHGPASWRDKVEREGLTPAGIERRGNELLFRLAQIRPPDDPMLRLRHQYLEGQTRAVVTRARIVAGERLSFDEESRLLYQATARHHDEKDYASVLERLESKIPGSGPLAERYEAYRARFAIPEEKLDTVFRAAIDGCRERTLRHIALPREESFTVEYVQGKSWSAYNWYQGDYRSVIQVNTDLPVFIDRAIDLACHEGYPGHHVYNALLEKNLLVDRGWVEFSIYALFSPQSLIAEGTANYGIEVAFPGDERLEYERRVLFPMAGLDPAGTELYYEIHTLIEQLKHSRNDAARRYLSGEMDAESTVAWLQRYALMTRGLAERRVRFMDQYRSYIINYTVGKDLVEHSIESKGGTDERPDIRWREFEKLISSPVLPAGL